MKNAKLILLVMLILFGIGNVKAQEQVKSVLVSGFVNSEKEFSISVVNDQNVKSKDEYKSNDKDFSVVLKKELDKWLSLGYEVVDSSIASTSDSIYRIVYFLTKK